MLGITGLRLMGWELGQGWGFFALTWTIVVLAIIHLFDSGAGRAMRSLRNGTLMAEAMSVSTLRYKITIFLIAALLASLSGWLFAHFQRTIKRIPVNTCP